MFFLRRSQQITEPRNSWACNSYFGMNNFLWKKKFAKKIISHSFETKNEGMQNKSAPSSLEQIQNMHRLDERALWKMNT